MADTWFISKEWKARLVEFAGRRLLRNVANGETATYDVSRSEGQVSQEGDAFNTKNMNDFEQRVANGFANAKTAVDTLSRDFISFQTSFRDGCSTIAAAITEMGVSTASNASPTVMASNIKKIKPLPLEAVAMLGIFGGGNINNSCIVPVDFAGIKSFTYTVYSDGNDNKRYDMYVRSGGLTGGAITNHYGVNGRSQSYTDTVDCTQFHGISGLYFYFSRKLEITNIVRL